MVALIGFGEIKKAHFWMCLVTELLGTALLVNFGCGACMYDAPVIQASLAFGVCVAIIVWCTAHVSGAHINPAVTAAFLATRKISLVRAIFYIISQCAGASLGALMLRMMTPRNHEYPTNATLNPIPTLGTPEPRSDITWIQTIGIESMITFILILTVFATCDDRRKGFSGGVGPIAIGLSIVMGHLWAVPLTGGATNPAAVFGTALVSGTWNRHWAYWLGDINGGVSAAMLYDFVLATNASKAKLRSFFSERDYDDSNFDEHGRVVEKQNKVHEHSAHDLYAGKDTSKL